MPDLFRTATAGLAPVGALTDPLERTLRQILSVFALHPPPKAADATRKRGAFGAVHLASQSALDGGKPQSWRNKSSIKQVWGVTTDFAQARPILMSARNPEVWKVVRFAAVFAIVLLGGFRVSGWRHAFGTSSPGKEAAFHLDDEMPPMPTILTAEELDVALKSRRSAFFVDADWSPNAVMSRRVVYPLVHCWRPLPGANRISFFRLDLTDPDEAIVGKLRLMLMRDINKLTRSGELLLRRDSETTIVDFPPVVDRLRLRERLDQLSED